MTHEEQEAFAACLKTAEAFVTIWKSGLSPERKVEFGLPEYEKLGWRFGVAVSAPRNRVTLQVFLLNPENNATKVLQSIDQSNIVQ